MELSMRWLADYVDVTDIPLAQYVHDMTMAGNKVEEIRTEGSYLSQVVVGRVLHVSPHPNADKLVVCSIDVGKKSPVQIVTGAKNVTAGVLVPVALDGATLAGNVTIQAQAMRGEASDGMLCSLSELGLTRNDFPDAVEDGIFLLPEDCSVGTAVTEAIGFNDQVLSFEITANRPDCMSVIGLAIETAALYDRPLHLKEPVVRGAGGDVLEHLKAENHQPDLCPRYTARVIKNVKIAPSPRWMRERLRASGVRPVNNLVDITNYVMLEQGQPMHAFDLRCLAGGQVQVRLAAEGETITTLDGVERVLDPEMLVIADANKPVAVAGVMGGEQSGIMPDTTTVVLESACFARGSVRRTAKLLGLRTDSSARYEKGRSPHTTLTCVNRACELVELLQAGEVVDGVIDRNHVQKADTKIKLDADWINRFLGTSIPRQQMVEILTRLQFTVVEDLVTVPPARADVTDPADLAEEIARFYGYDNIPLTAPSGLAAGVVTPEQKLIRQVGEIMRGLGCHEIITYSFVSPAMYDALGFPADSPRRDSVVIRNPLGDTTSLLRNTTLVSMLDILAKNYSNRNDRFWAYEIGKEYHPVEGQELPDEQLVLTIGLYGGNADFYLLKGMIEALLSELGAKTASFAPYTEDQIFHLGRTATVSQGDLELGLLGEVSPSVCEHYRLGTRTYLARLPLAALSQVATVERSYRSLPKFPAMQRDLSLVCDRILPVAAIESVIRRTAGEILEDLTLFDVYEGSQVPDGQKSVSYALTFRSASATMTDPQADALVADILKALSPVGVNLRT